MQKERTCDDLAQDLQENVEELRIISDGKVLEHAQALDLQPRRGDAIVGVVRLHLPLLHAIQDGNQLWQQPLIPCKMQIIDRDRI